MKFILILSFLEALAFSLPLAQFRFLSPRVAPFRAENVQNLARQRAIQLNRARQAMARQRQANPRNLQNDFNAVAVEHNRVPVVTPDGVVNNRGRSGNLITPETPAGSVPNLEADSVARQLNFE